MAEVKLSNGFSTTTEKLRFDDYELLEDITNSDKRPELIPSILLRLLGEEDLKRFKDAARSADGIVHIKDMKAALAELFEAVGEAEKN